MYRAKQRLLEIYSKKPEDKYDLAVDLVMVTTPSDLARRIVDLICDNKTQPLNMFWHLEKKDFRASQERHCWKIICQWRNG